MNWEECILQLHWTVHAVVHTQHFINKHNVKCKPYGPWGHFLGHCTLKPITLSLRRLWRAGSITKGQSVSPIGTDPIYIPSWKGASPYPQLERGRTTSPNGKGPNHVPNWKGASPCPQLERVQAISLTRKGPVHYSTQRGPIHSPKWKGANPYPELEGAQPIFPTRKGDNPYPQLERGQRATLWSPADGRYPDAICSRAEKKSLGVVAK